MNTGRVRWGMSIALAMAEPSNRRHLHALSGSGTPDPEPPDDSTRIRALVELAQGGDTEAFGQLYDRYVTGVFRYVYFRVGSTQLAEDLTAETFLRALRSLHTFQWKGKDFSAWLTTIARNLINDHFKSRRVRSEFSTDSFPDRATVAQGPEEDVLASRVLRRSGNQSLDVYLKLTRRTIVTATYDTEHHVTFERLSPTLATSRSVSTRIVELGGDDRGFLWRLNSYWRYQQVGDGVLVEMRFELLDGTSTHVTVAVSGFSGEGMLEQVVDTIEGFSIVLCDLKTLLETGTSAGLVRDKAALISMAANK